MSKKVYYTINLQCELDGETISGNKIVQVYVINNNEIEPWFDLYLGIDETTVVEIQEWLDGNGYGDTQVQLVEL